MTKIKIDPKKKIFYWGPVDGRPAFPDFWNLGMYLFSKTYKPGWAETLIYFENETMTFVCDYKKLFDNGETIFKKYIINKERFRKAYRHWEKAVRNFKEIIRVINGENLSELTNKKLASLFLKFSTFYSQEFWYHGLMPEIANWGGEQLLTRELRKNISKEKNFIHALERLTAPEGFSFYQKEELDLFAIKLDKNKKRREEKIREHQKKYFWILNNYHHTKIISLQYFRRELRKVAASKAKKRIEEIRKIKSNALVRKKRIIKKYKLSKNILQISRKLSFCIWWQDLRKSYILQANHIINYFLKEFSRRYRLETDDLYFYTAKDLERLVAGKVLGSNEIKKRKEHFLVNYVPDKKGTNLFSGKEAKKYFQPYAKKDVDKNIREFEGLVVNRGIARGRAKILTNYSQIEKVKKGDILVAAMTTPDYIVALKRASAIVTDEGGMTCHAAIVARELNIPAIVGTKIATQVLRDGDVVEVDANKGIVKIKR